jgi:hypothetical protein
MTQSTTEILVLVAAKDIVTSAYSHWRDALDETAWCERGEFRLKDSVIQELAGYAATNLGGSVKETYYDAPAGGYFAVIQLG